VRTGPRREGGTSPERAKRGRGQGTVLEDVPGIVMLPRNVALAIMADVGGVAGYGG